MTFDLLTPQTFDFLVIRILICIMIGKHDIQKQTNVTEHYEKEKNNQNEFVVFQRRTRSS